ERQQHLGDAVQVGGRVPGAFGEFGGGPRTERVPAGGGERHHFGPGEHVGGGRGRLPVVALRTHPARRTVHRPVEGFGDVPGDADGRHRGPLGGGADVARLR